MFEELLPLITLVAGGAFASVFTEWVHRARRVDVGTKTLAAATAALVVACAAVTVTFAQRTDPTFEAALALTANHQEVRLAVGGRPFVGDNSALSETSWLDFRSVTDARARALVLAHLGDASLERLHHDGRACERRDGPKGVVHVCALATNGSYLITFRR